MTQETPNMIQNANNESDYQITVLSPSDDLKDSDSYKSYEKRLIAALKRELVFNIALTGIYGSGKSSILNTFKKSHKDNWNFLDVSLSTFKVEKSGETKKSEDVEEKTTKCPETIEKEIPSLTAEQIQLIERSILQQFFYSVPQSEIPLSRFKRITENSKEEYKETFYVILIVFWSYAYALDQLDFITGLLDFPKSFDYLNLVALIISTIYLIHKIYRYTFGLKEIKFNLHNAEFNIKNEEDKSILNDHLDEILYFFEATKKNVVIIEDLDRFNDTEIFIRLRELNSIINKSRPNNRVIFIYAIRDDIFEDSERSKFFDYIIPVIPIVNPTNAYDIVKKEYSDVANLLDNRFLRKTCLHFSDMRLLKNILNEYQSYLDQLGVLDIDKNKLFAIIVYKNYYPNEFAKLNSNEGEVYNLFYKEKKVLIERLIEAKKQEIDDLQTKKYVISTERLNSVKELNSVYAYAILSELDSSFSSGYYSNSSIAIEVNGIQYNADTISNTEALKECAEHPHIQLSIINTDFNKSLEFNEIEKEVDPNNSYLDRLANITAKENGELVKLSNEESSLRNEVLNIKRMKLEQLFKKDSVVIEKPLLRYFITNGFIDETYQDYISHFFEASITLNDKNYAILVSSFEEPSFELELKNCGELIENYLSPEELSTQSALNFSMLDYFLSNVNDPAYLSRYLEVVCDQTNISNEFLRLYFKRDKNLHLLIPKIVDIRETIIDDINIYNNSEDARFNLKRFIRHLPFPYYENLTNLTETFRGELNLLNDYVDFILDCFDNDIDRFKEFTDTIKPKLEHANFSENQIEELNWLGRNGYLAINKKMIEQILKNNLSESYISDLEVKPLTTIANSGIDYLVNAFWSESLSEYVELFLEEDSNQKSYIEDESIYIKVLNRLGQFDSVIEKLIEHVSTKVKDIDSINDPDTKKHLIGQSKVSHTWSNVFKYFSKSYYDEEGTCRWIDKSLEKFLENGASTLRYKVYSESDVEDIKDWKDTKAEFDEYLYARFDLSDEAYKKLIKITDKNWDNSKLKNLSDDKVETLIRLDKLSLTPENWEQVKEYTSDKVTQSFLVHHHKAIIEDLDAIELRPEDLKTLLNATNISNSDKRILAKIEAHNLMGIDEKVRQKVMELYKDEILPDTIYEQFKQYADSYEIQDYLSNQLDYLDKNKVVELLSLMDEPYHSLATGQEVEFPNTTENQKLLEALNNAQIVIKPSKPKKSKGNFLGEKVITTKLQAHVMNR